ncbi:bacteriocin immunity protein [Paenibacillus sp. NPDC056579]|uniref:bacteriocin immunity protein n=1 Tax=Paenibacillus sp. NPDC056579 TaxID=3345871 RepID=UPI00367E6533
MKALSKEELIELVRKIMNVEGSEEEIDNMIDLLKYSVPHPEVSDLIYWNENELTAEQVVEQALSYKPIQL